MLRLPRLTFCCPKTEASVEAVKPEAPASGRNLDQLNAAEQNGAELRYRALNCFR